MPSCFLSTNETMAISVANLLNSLSSSSLSHQRGVHLHYWFSMAYGDHLETKPVEL